MEFWGQIRKVRLGWRKLIWFISVKLQTLSVSMNIYLCSVRECQPKLVTSVANWHTEARRGAPNKDMLANISPQISQKNLESSPGLSNVVRYCHLFPINRAGIMVLRGMIPYKMPMRWIEWFLEETSRLSPRPARVYTIGSNAPYMSTGQTHQNLGILMTITALTGA